MRAETISFLTYASYYNTKEEIMELWQREKNRLFSRWQIVELDLMQNYEDILVKSTAKDGIIMFYPDSIRILMGGRLISWS